MATTSAARPRGRPTNSADQPLPSTQQRSRATTEHLLAAAEDLLCTGGADAATLRGIAGRAGVSLAIVYRRFPDKDAVLRAVYTRFFSRVASTNARVLAGKKLQRASLEQAAATLVAGIADGYRRNRPLLRALVLYARTHPDPDFRRRAAAMNAVVFADVGRIIELHRAEISHPRPKAAVSFAIAAVASVLAERILFGDATSMPALSYRRMTAETTRLFLAYLQFGRCKNRRLLQRSFR